MFRAWRTMTCDKCGCVHPHYGIDKALLVSLITWPAEHMQPPSFSTQHRSLSTCFFVFFLWGMLGHQFRVSAQLFAACPLPAVAGRHLPYDLRVPGWAHSGDTAGFEMRLSVRCVCISIYLSIYISIYLSTYLPISYKCIYYMYLYIYMCVCVSIYVLVKPFFVPLNPWTEVFGSRWPLARAQHLSVLLPFRAGTVQAGSST